jgi:hypothetical protein
MELAKPARVVLRLLRPDIAQELDRVGQSPRAANKEPANDLLKAGSVRIRLSAWREDLDRAIYPNRCVAVMSVFQELERYVPQGSDLRSEARLS